MQCSHRCGFFILWWCFLFVLFCFSSLSVVERQTCMCSLLFSLSSLLFSILCSSMFVSYENKPKTVSRNLNSNFRSSLLCPKCLSMTDERDDQLTVSFQITWKEVRAAAGGAGGCTALPRLTGYAPVTPTQLPCACLKTLWHTGASVNKVVSGGNSSLLLQPAELRWGRKVSFCVLFRFKQTLLPHINKETLM